MSLDPKYFVFIVFIGIGISVKVHFRKQSFLIAELEIIIVPLLWLSKWVIIHNWMEQLLRREILHILFAPSLPWTIIWRLSTLLKIVLRSFWSHERREIRHSIFFAGCLVLEVHMRTYEREGTGAAAAVIDEVTSRWSPSSERSYVCDFEGGIFLRYWIRELMSKGQILILVLKFTLTLAHTWFTEILWFELNPYGAL